MPVNAIHEKVTTLKQRVNHEHSAHVQAFVQGMCKIGKGECRRILTFLERLMLPAIAFDRRDPSSAVSLTTRHRPSDLSSCAIAAAIAAF